MLQYFTMSMYFQPHENYSYNIMKLSKYSDFTFYNYLIFVIGVLLITIGYVLMALGDTYSFLSLRLSPLLLFAGYCVLIPVSILANFNKQGWQFNWLEHLPVTQEVAGSSPVHPAQNLTFKWGFFYQNQSKKGLALKLKIII